MCRSASAPGTWRPPASRATARRSPSWSPRRRDRYGSSDAERPRWSWRRACDDPERAPSAEFAGAAASGYDADRASPRVVCAPDAGDLRRHRHGPGRARPRPRRRRSAGARSVHPGEHLLRPGPVRQGDRRLAEGLSAQERRGIPLQHRPGLSGDGERRKGHLLLQALPGQLSAQGAQPGRGRAEDRGAAKAASAAGPGQTDSAAGPARPGQSGAEHKPAPRRHDPAAVILDGRDRTSARRYADDRDRRRRRDRRDRAGRNLRATAPVDLGAAIGFDTWASGVQGSAAPSFALTLAGGYTFGATTSTVRFRLGLLFGYTFLQETDSKDSFTSFLIDPTVEFRLAERVR